MKFSVPDMNCGHCTSAIEKAVKALDADAQVQCDLDASTVTITSAKTEAELTAAIDDAGFDSSVIAA